jgi:hypothetical protein
MRLTGTVSKVEPDKIVVQFPNYKCITVRRNDTDRWEKNPLTVWHVIAIHGFDDPLPRGVQPSGAQRDILGMAVEVSTDLAGIVRVSGGWE